MSFYTSVVRYGNSMLYRGYDPKGKKVYKRDPSFQPEFFVSSQKETDWRGLDDSSIGSVSFAGMREAKNWLEENKQVSGRNLYGNPNFIHKTRSFKLIDARESILRRKVHATFP